MEKLTIPNSKGQQLSIRIHHPETHTGKVAIVCPGFLDSCDYSGLLELASMLADRGFTVVRFNPTGTWDSEGDISEYTVTQYLEDIESIKSYLEEQMEVTQILMAGHSRGGRTAILSAAHKAKISGVVAIMSSLSTSRRSKWNEPGGYHGLRDLPESPDKKVEFVVPISHLEDALVYDTTEALDTLSCPLLVLAGENDTTSPLEKVREVYDAAREPKTFKIALGTGHDYRHFPEEVAHVNSLVQDWLDEHSL